MKKQFNFGDWVEITNSLQGFYNGAKGVVCERQSFKDYDNSYFIELRHPNVANNERISYQWFTSSELKALKENE